MIPFVKLEKKLMSEGCRIVRTMRSVDGDECASDVSAIAFSWSCSVLGASSLDNVACCASKELRENEARWVEAAGVGCSSMVSVAVALMVR